MARVAISTTVDEEIYKQWIDLCKKQDKNSFQLLRDVVLLILNKKAYDIVFPKGHP